MKIIAVAITLILLFTNLNLANENNVIVVDDEGDGDFVSIQAAINAANDGDKIEVYSGIYRENIVIDKRISLIGIPHELGEGNDEGKPVIEGKWSENETVAIEIKAPCMIKNFSIYGNVIGIEINGSGCTISHNFIADHVNGVLILKNDCIVSNNIFYNNSVDAIHIDSSMRIGIFNNSIEKSLNGIEIEFYNALDNPPHITLKNNSMENCGLEIKGNTLASYCIDADESNKINGKPLIYLINKSNAIAPSNAGQIFLINCSNCNVSNSKIEHVSSAISLIYSRNNKIYGNVINSCDTGIKIIESGENMVEENEIEDCGMGLALYDSSDNNISKNVYSRNIYDGITMEGCNGNIVSKNIIVENNDNGLFMYDSCKNVIRGNMIERNGFNAIELYYCNENDISYNTMDENKEWNIELEGSMMNKIYNNNFMKSSHNAIMINSFLNSWHRNYWNNWHIILPKPILGMVIFFPRSHIFPWIDFDMFPRIKEVEK